MKLRSILCGMLAIAAAVACKPDEPVVAPELDINKTSALVTAAGEEIALEVTSNVDWTASADQDWVSVDPASGKGSAEAAKVKVTVDPNETQDSRTATVTVSADNLTKTLKITQTGLDAPEPETYILVGDAVGGWDPINNGVILTLENGYYVAKAVEITAKKGMHFTKNAVWEGNVKGLHGLIAPNEIGEVGSNDISLTEGGKFDVYLTEALDKFYFMSEGKLPSEAVEHVKISTVWGVCGAIEGNNWGASADPVMEEDGEWFVAKGVSFTEVNFKVRGNNSWADDVKWGRAAEDQVCELNKAIAVSTCTEYKAANEGAGDNPNVYIDAPAGTYDIYFSPEKKEVWVMTPGYKPGEAPEPADVDIDGKQWCFTWAAMGGASCVLDLGVTAEGTAILAYDMGGMWAPYMVFEYAVAKTDGTSGKLVLSVDGQSVEIPYSKATETTVHFESEGFLMENIDCTIATELIPIEYSSANYTLEGYQWIAEVEGRQVLFDFGYTEEGMLSIAFPSMDGTEFHLFMAGFYEITPFSGSSGVVTFYQYDWEFDEEMEPFDFIYSDLGETSVTFESENILGVSDPVTFLMVNYPFDITLPGGGGDGPQGEIPNGEYWFVEPTTQKVMTPLDNTKNFGRPASVDAVNGASTAKNAFTFTYDPDWTGFTIQDSYGRYLYNDMQDEFTPYRTISVSYDIPADSDENKAFYLWTVFDNGDGTYDIYNFATYYSITYSPTYNNWEVYDYQADDFTNLFPTLVKADNPVEEPTEPAGPEKITIAEFAALEDGDTVYELTGTITRIVTPYNSNYNNISINIQDETAEIQLYRLSCAGVADPAALTVGDEITVQGAKGSYNGVAQMAAGGKYISHIDKEAPAPEAGTYELSFADVANRTSFSSTQQIWEQNGVKFTNDKASSTSDVADYVAPARFYAKSSIKVEKAGMSKIVFYLNSGKPASGLTDSISDSNASVSTEGSVVTVTFTNAVDVFEVASLAAQIRMDSLTVYAE